jgi:hypothetical protein
MEKPSRFVYHHSNDGIFVSRLGFVMLRKKSDDIFMIQYLALSLACLVTLGLKSFILFLARYRIEYICILTLIASWPNG